ncbi:7TM chemoreceptor [Cooperia oncophora]
MLQDHEMRTRYSFMLHCFSHWLWSLLYSFAYRYYILSHSQPKTRTVVLIIFLLYIPSFVQFVSFCFGSDNVEEVKLLIAKKFNYDMTRECVSGHLDIFDWKVLGTILHMTLPIAPVYTAILILRKLTMAKLTQERIMSENSKQLHKQLLKALTIQACLPIFFLFAVITYALGQLSIYNHPLLEYATFILASCIPVFCPVTSFYFVRPYRVWIRKKLLCLSIMPKSQSISKMATTRSSLEISKTNF